MNIPRWIKDDNPDESIESRVLSILFVVQNGFTQDSSIHFNSERELLGWVASELTALWNKIKSS